MGTGGLGGVRKVCFCHFCPFYALSAPFSLQTRLKPGGSLSGSRELNPFNIPGRGGPDVEISPVSLLGRTQVPGRLMLPFLSERWERSVSYVAESEKRSRNDGLFRPESEESGVPGRDFAFIALLRCIFPNRLLLFRDTTGTCAELMSAHHDQQLSTTVATLGIYPRECPSGNNVQDCHPGMCTFRTLTRGEERGPLCAA